MATAATIQPNTDKACSSLGLPDAEKYNELNNDGWSQIWSFSSGKFNALTLLLKYLYRVLNE